MLNNENRPGIIQIGPTLKESLLLCKENFFLFFSIGLIAYCGSIFQLLLTFFNIPVSWFDAFLLVLSLVVNLWANPALILAVSKKYMDENINISRSFMETRDKIWRFVGVGILSFLILIVGYLLLFIPGLYWGTVFSLACVVLVLENTTLFESFVRSKNLIKRNFWSIFGLYTLLLLIFLPFMFIFKIDMNANVKTGFIYLVLILFGILNYAISINVYNKLKAAKTEILLAEGKVIKKGMGCLGCLGMMGLSIAAIVLMIIWLTFFVAALRTEQGNKVYEKFSKRVSPEIEFPGGVTLKRPEGYWVRRGQKEFIYYLYGVIDKSFFRFYIYSIPYNELGITKTSSLKLEDHEIWDKYYEYIVRQSWSSEIFKDMEKSSLEIINIAGKNWAQYILKEKENTDTKNPRIFVYNYTFSNDHVISVSYGYKKNPTESINQNQIQQANKILSSFNFDVKNTEMVN